MIAKEIVIQLKTPIIAMASGFVTMSVSQLDYINDLLGDTEGFVLAKNAIALIGAALFFWKAYHTVSKTNREKDQAYEEKAIDIERKSWELAHEQKKANEEGLIEVIKELEQTMKNFKK